MEFRIDGQSFYKAIDNRTETPYISEIHPYDLTHYHWARKVPNMKYISLWDIYNPKGRIAEKVQISIAVPEQEEQEIIARKLLYWDEKAKLVPHIDHT